MPTAGSAVTLSLVLRLLCRPTSRALMRVVNELLPVRRDRPFALRMRWSTSAARDLAAYTSVTFANPFWATGAPPQCRVLLLSFSQLPSPRFP